MITATDQHREVSFTVELDDGPPQDIFLRSDRPVLTDSPEAYIAATLLSTMQTGEDLAPPGPLDPTFTSNLETIQDIYANWYPELQRVTIEADVADPGGIFESCG